MKPIEFTEEEIRQLAYESVYHQHPIVRRRMQALLLKSQGLSRRRIAQILNLNPSTVRTYFNLFVAGRVQALQRLGYLGKPNRLQERIDDILPALEAHPPATLKEAQAQIEAVSGLKRSLTQVSLFLKKTRWCAAK